MLTCITTNIYDLANRVLSTSQPLSKTTAQPYDLVGNHTRITENGARIIDYACDGKDRLVSVNDPPGLAMTYGYKIADNQVSITDTLGHMVSYGYDAVGNRTSQTKADGTVLDYDYDAVNRLESITYPDGTISYAYDAANNRTSMVDPTGTTTYTYDDLDRLIQVASPQGTLGYSYDLFDNRTSIVYPGGNTMTYAYDVANRLSTVTDYGLRVAQYAYDDANRLTTIAYPNGIEAAYTYDNADRLLILVHTHPVNGTIVTAAYTLDNIGNRLTMADLEGTSTYTYDNLYRLTQVACPYGETVTYAYDPMGNRTSMTSSLHGTTTYSYDAADRQFPYTEPGGTVTLSNQPFTYAGQQADNDLALVFLRARYLDTASGRFLTYDPHPGALISPQSLNKYLYATNNPTFISDKDGEFIIPLIVVGVVGYGTYRALDNFLDRANQMEQNGTGYYNLNPQNVAEWEQKYKNYNPMSDYVATLAAGVEVGRVTPGTSFSGPPPGISGNIGKSSLVTWATKKLMEWLSGFKGPEPYIQGQGDVQGIDSESVEPGQGTTESSFGWNRPPGYNK